MDADAGFVFGVFQLTEFESLADGSALLSLMGGGAFSFFPWPFRWLLRTNLFRLGFLGMMLKY